MPRLQLFTRFPVLLALTTLAATGCVHRRPLELSEPTRVAAERPGHRAPTPAVRWYNDFWHAIADGNVKVAWILAESRDERRFAEALQAMFDGDQPTAESTLTSLLHSRDTVVSDAARLAYGALLSSDGRWPRLASFADSATRLLPDQAGIESWAPAFRTVNSSVQFSDSVITLPLTRSVTGAPVVPVTINGVVRHFWLDTGSSITIVSSDVATACQLKETIRDTLQLLTSVGRLPARPTVVRSMRIGGAIVTDAPAMIVDAAALRLRSDNLSGAAARQPDPIDGVIGFDVIRTLDLTVDDVRHRVTIRKPVLLKAAKSNRPRNLMWFGVPIVTLLSESGAPVHLALDTGAEETFGTPSLVTKTGAHWAPAERRNVRGFGGSTVERGIVVPNVRLFLNDVPVSLERLFLYEAQYPTIFALDGTLGADVGRGGVMRIDMTNGRLDVSQD